MRHLFSRRLDDVRSATPSPEYALDIRSLSFSYGRKNVLQDVSLAVRPGQICGLLGPNGSGKSTLFRCCMGFLHPEKGRIHVHGVNIAHMKPSELARHVARILSEHDYRVENIDATILCQRPKLAPHIPAMRANLAAAFGLPVDAVSVKATTEEHLGFTGEGLGIAAHAVALIETR